MEECVAIKANWPIHFVITRALTLAFYAPPQKKKRNQNVQDRKWTQKRLSV